jgi:hypothetical protein
LSEIEWTLLKERLTKEQSASALAPATTSIALPEPVQKEVNSRCMEIARRAAELTPPIPMTILMQLESYNAAKNIPWDLMESEWPSLRKRLKEQFEARYVGEVRLPSQPALQLNATAPAFAPTAEAETKFTSTITKRRRNDKPAVHEDIDQVGSLKKKVMTEPPVAPETSNSVASQPTREASLPVSAIILDAIAVTSQATSTSTLVSSSKSFAAHILGY